MKRISFYRLTGWVCLLGVLTACSDNEEFPTFRCDVDGTCYQTSPDPISRARFEASVVGSGWKYAATYEIMSDGTCSRQEYYEDLIGGAPSVYYFESGETMKEYFYLSIRGAWGFHTRAIDYEEGSNRVMMGDDLMLFQLLAVEGDVLKMVEYLGVLNGGRKVYGYSTYYRMTEEELRKCQEKYDIDFDNMHDLQLSLPGDQEVFIATGTDFAFDVLDCQEAYTVKPMFENTCTIVQDGNHVQVKLLKNGAYLTVSDRLQHRPLWIFSTDESLEPDGSTDIYSFDYAELTLTEDNRLVAPDGYVLPYDIARMGTTPRDEYYGSILSRYNPSALLVVDADKQARFFRLDRGDIFIKDLLPPETLTDLAAKGDGSELVYKLELANVHGSVFQILPFKVTYRVDND